MDAGLPAHYLPPSHRFSPTATPTPTPTPPTSNRRRDSFRWFPPDLCSCYTQIHIRPGTRDDPSPLCHPSARSPQSANIRDGLLGLPETLLSSVISVSLTSSSMFSPTSPATSSHALQIILFLSLVNFQNNV